MNRSTTLRHTLKVLILAGACLAASCKGNDATYLVVTIERGTLAGDVEKLDLLLDFDGQQASRLLEKGGAFLTLPTTAVFEIRNGQGMLAVTARAYRGAAELSHGSASGEIRRGATNHITVELGRDQMPDGGTTDSVGGDTNPSLAVLSSENLSMSFGSVATGHSSVVQTVSFRNLGGRTSGPLTVVSDSGEFIVQPPVAGDCGIGSTSTTLAPDARCTVRVVFAPSAAGTRNGSLTVTATPGGTAAVALSGTAFSPGALTLSAETLDFGKTPVGVPVTKRLSLSNGGGAEVSGLQFAIAGAGSAQFSRGTGAANDCGSTLAAGASCDVRMTFAATTAGLFSGTLSAWANAGALTAAANLTGEAQNPVVLDGAPDTMDFGDQEIGTLSMSKTWTVTNTGTVTTSAAPSLSNTNAAEFPAVSDCTGALAPGSSCTITVKFTPTQGGARSSTITIASDASTASLSVTGRSMLRVTVARSVGGAPCSSCTVQSADAARSIDCGSSCASASALYPAGTTITLRARTINDSGHWFDSWDGPSSPCRGPERDCTFTVTNSVTLSAQFPPMVSNLVFHTSTEQSTSLGSAKAYDAICNAAATAAGINNGAGNAYVAWMSDVNSLATSRLFASALTQGWLRMDGRVFATSRTDLLTNGAVLNPAVFDENGVRRVAEVMTGTFEDGSLAVGQTCSNWTSSDDTAYLIGGQTDAGPGSWTAGFGSGCAAKQRVLCLGTNGTLALTPAGVTGKRIWVTASQFTMGGDPDAFCNSNRPAAVMTAKAFVATTAASAGSLLAPEQVYVRPDGQRVGTGASIAAGLLETGIWQSNAASGAYMPVGFGRVWTGAQGPSAIGAVTSTCRDWTDLSQTGAFGLAARSSIAFFGFTSGACSAAGDERGQLYCFEP